MERKFEIETPRCLKNNSLFNPVNPYFLRSQGQYGAGEERLMREESVGMEIKIQLMIKIVILIYK